MMKPLISTLALLALATFSHAEHHAAEKWIQLFNGKDLTGWTPKFTKHDLGVNYNNTVKVKDGLLTIDYSEWDQFEGEFGHLFYKGAFSHYKLRAEYRFIGEQVKGGPGWALRNNGFMIHGQSAESMKKGQDFPTSLEVQLLGGLGKGERPTGNLIMVNGLKCLIDGKPNKKRITNSASETFHGDQWVTIELEVRGDAVKISINGEDVIACTKLQNKDGSPRDKGTISIQAETHPIQFRKVELLPLEPGQ